jgi:hypothetical protein
VIGMFRCCCGNRYGQLSFVSQVDMVLHGLAGYFETVLFTPRSSSTADAGEDSESTVQQTMNIDSAVPLPVTVTVTGEASRDDATSMTMGSDAAGATSFIPGPPPVPPPPGMMVSLPPTVDSAGKACCPRLTCVCELFVLMLQLVLVASRTHCRSGRRSRRRTP